MSEVVDREEAIARLRRGRVVAVPTDTVYGVAAALDHPDAVANLFVLKRRPASVALPVLVGSPGTIERLGASWPEPARRLARAFWPGALTIVVATDHALAASVGGEGTVGFRVPDDETLLAVIEGCGPLAASSANEHGAPPCQSAAEVLTALGDNELLDAVLDDGERRGEVSTVLEVRADSWRVLRDGAISLEDIERAL